MSINCLVNRRVKETKRRRDEETKRGREEESKRLKDKESKRQRVKEIKRKRGKEKPRKPLEEYGGCAAAVMLPFWSYKSKLLTPKPTASPVPSFRRLPFSSRR